LGADIIDWKWLSGNLNAIKILEKNPDAALIDLHSKSIKRPQSHIIEFTKQILLGADKINKYMLSRNPNGISILEKNLNKIYWIWLSENSNAIHLLEKTKIK
jgi:hypothetical protein